VSTSYKVHTGILHTSGTNNDLNVLHRSPVFLRLAEGQCSADQRPRIQQWVLSSRWYLPRVCYICEHNFRSCFREGSLLCKMSVSMSQGCRAGIWHASAPFYYCSVPFSHLVVVLDMGGDKSLCDHVLHDH
jgi:hypothetical protein